MPEVFISDESIRLGQLLKLAGVAEDGVHARMLIESGQVLIDSDVETRRGAQVRPGARVTVAGDEFILRTET